MNYYDVDMIKRYAVGAKMNGHFDYTFTMLVNNEKHEFRYSTNICKRTFNNDIVFLIDGIPYDLFSPKSDEEKDEALQFFADLEDIRFALLEKEKNHDLKNIKSFVKEVFKD